ncbi:MAG: glycosyltransferase [Acidimicrobiia bacterium]|nr:glycosyltransferase [Acidimicrobiia bacterium]
MNPDTVAAPEGRPARAIAASGAAPEGLTGAVSVIAKTPEAGRVKTRLCPPLDPAEAAQVAWACLLDTLDVARLVPASRHVIVLDGEPGGWCNGFEVIPQRGDGLAERLAAAFDDMDASALVVAMDTPQLAANALVAGLRALQQGADAVFGPASDGGYWLIGLRAGVDAAPVFAGIPMSTGDTGRRQLARLRELGLAVHVLDELRDLDGVDDLEPIARLAPGGRLARLIQDLGLGRSRAVGLA